MVDFFKKIVVTGVKGQLGFDCVRELQERGYKNIVAIDREDLDLTHEEEVKAFFAKEKPEVVLHNAAMTQVDKIEEGPEKAYEANSLATKYIAEACKKIDAVMVYISTDYVFNGKGENFYKETDEKEPLNYYGYTKSKGEDFVTSILKKYFILRISWVFGINGNNFIKTMLRLADSNKELSIVDDQIGSPTYTYDLSKLICDMIETKKFGMYHATNEGVTSWYEFAKYIFEVADKKVSIKPISTEEYQKKYKQAHRPLNSRLSKEKLKNSGFNALPDWKDATKRYIINELKVK